MVITKTASLLNEWRRWWSTLAFVDALYSARRKHVSTDHR